MRSCASLIQISTGLRPAYFSGARSSQTSAPTSSPISPTALEKPPAPQSVTAVNSSRSRACRIVSRTFFSSIGLPICTAPPRHSVSDSSCSVSLENVAPWMPSRPVRPPTATISRRGCAAFERLAARDDADGAGVHDRVAEVAVVEAERAVDGRDAHPVAVVAHAGDDALHDAQRDAARPWARPSYRRLPKQNTSVFAIGLRGEAGAEDVADDAADAGSRAAVRLDRARVVVRLHLEADVVFLVEADDAGVVLENRDAPLLVELLRGGEDGLLEQVVVALLAEAHGARERLVLAVLRPGLRERLQLAEARRAAERVEPFLDGAHLDGVEREHVATRERQKLLVPEPLQRNGGHRLAAAAARQWARRRNRAEPDLLDHLVGQRAADGVEDLLGRLVRLDPVGEPGDGAGGGLAQGAERAQHRGLDRVHDARTLPRGDGGAAPLDGPVDGALLQHAVDEQFVGGATGIAQTLDAEDAMHADVVRVEPRECEARAGIHARGIGPFRVHADFDARPGTHNCRLFIYKLL